MNDEILRKECKLLKALCNITYKQQASLLGVHYNSFHNWIKGYYSFSESRKRKLQQIIANLKES